MRNDGFTLIELLIVVAVMGILLNIATIQFNEYNRKSQIESQAKMIFSDLATIRSEAFYQKRSRAVIISGTTFNVYSSAVTSGINPIETKTLRRPVTLSSTATIVFDERGVFNESPYRAICSDAVVNPATVDTVVLGTMRGNLAKRSSTFTGCNSANVTLR